MQGSSEFNHIGPFDMRTYDSDITIGGNNASVVLGKIYNTPGNTWLNKAKGRLVELPGKYSYSGNPLKTMNDSWLSTYRDRY